MTEASNVTELQTDDKLIKEATDQHGDVVVFKTPQGLAIFKRPSQADFEAYTDKIAGDSPLSAAARSLCYSCAVTPDLEGIKTIFAKSPALPLKVSRQLQTLAGSQLEGEIKKA
jgi:hypothetical protein